MDYKDKININQSYGYFWQSNKIAENCNFYDYKTQEPINLFVIEGFPEHDFKNYIDSDTDGLSIGYNGIVDIKNIFDFCPNVKVLYLKCESIQNADFFQYFEKLEYISFIGTKNANINFILPLQLKSFVCVWKNKYKIEILPENQLEYLSIEYGLTFEFEKLFKLSTNLLKIELFKCVLSSTLTSIANLNHLNYLSLTNCTMLDNDNNTQLNESLKYLYLSKTKFNDCFFSQFYGLEVLIIEDCNEIESILFLKNLLKIRGLWISGNTKIIDGNFSFLEKLLNLQNLFIRDYKHYTYRSKIMWDWERFFSNNKAPLFEIK
jgi:hypothetical protein